MPDLSNPKWEAFARAYASQPTGSKDYIKAYESCGYKSKNDAAMGASARRLLQNAQIRDRIVELAERVTVAVVESAKFDRNWVLEQLGEIAAKAKQDIPVLNAKGEPTGEYTFQGMVAVRAIELIGKDLGMFQPSASQQVQTVALATEMFRQMVLDSGVLNKQMDGMGGRVSPSSSPALQLTQAHPNDRAEATQ